MIINTYEESRKLTDTVIQGIKDKKGKDIVCIHIGKNENAVAEFFVICHGTSRTQVGAIADSVVEKVRRDEAQKPLHVEGFENAEWILLDYIDVVVHVFEEEKRAFFKLEDLWGDSDIERMDEKYEKD